MHARRERGRFRTRGYGNIGDKKVNRVAVTSKLQASKGAGQLKVSL